MVKLTRMSSYLNLTPDNINQEHICCAITDRKCATGYQAKKKWLTQEFANGYVFRRLNERAKVFIEYGPAEQAWVPITAKYYMNINCFWVSGKYKKNGHGKALLKYAINDAKAQGKDGLVTVVGTKKYHFMSDTIWLLQQGFKEVALINSGFSLLVLHLTEKGELPQFNDSVKSATCNHTEGIVVYYSNRCPFAEFHATASLTETAAKRNIPLKIIKLNSLSEAQNAPSPATIFSLFLNGKFVTTDVSVCMDSRYDKIVGKALK
jgi:GNAT superfamily N-acetyltransferase